MRKTQIGAIRKEIDSRIPEGLRRGTIQAKNEGANKVDVQLTGSPSYLKGVRVAGATDVRSARIGDEVIVGLADGTPVVLAIMVKSQGNMIVPYEMRSDSFIGGMQGWRISRNGDAEFGNIIVRGEIRGSVMAKQTINSVGGSLMVSPSTVLCANVSSSDTYIDVVDPIFNVGDIVLLNPDVSRLEYMRITGIAAFLVGRYRYNVTRNLDLTGANYFYKGEPVVSTGDAYAIADHVSGYLLMRADDTTGPYYDAFVRNSGTYNDVTRVTRMGNLNGSYGITANYWGFAAGKYGIAGNTSIVVDTNSGIRILNNTTQVAQWKTDGSILIGQEAINQSNVYITSGAIQLRNNTDAKITIAANGSISMDGSMSVGTAGHIKGGATAYGIGTGFWLGYDTDAYKFYIGATGGGELTYDGANLSVTGAINASSGSFTGSITIGTGGVLKSGVTDFLHATDPESGWWLDHNGGTPRFRVGASASGALVKGIVWDGTNLYWKSATSILHSDGYIYVGDGVSDDIAGISSAGSVRMWVGHATATSAPFQIHDSGSMHTAPGIEFRYAATDTTDIGSIRASYARRELTIRRRTGNTEAGESSVVFEVQPSDSASYFFRHKLGASYLSWGDVPSGSGWSEPVYYIGFNSASNKALRFKNAGEGSFDAYVDGVLHLVIEDEQTIYPTTVLTLGHNSTGTPGSGLGAQILFQAETTTTENVDQALIAARWYDATHATRSSYLQFATLNNTVMTEWLFLLDNGELGLNTVYPDRRFTIKGVAGEIPGFSLLNSAGGGWYFDHRNNNEGLGNDLWISYGGDAIFCIDPENFRFGVSTQDPKATIHGITNDAITDAITNVAILGHNTSGTAATGFGTGLLFQGETTTTINTDMCRIAAAWSDATHATRGSYLSFYTGTGGAALSERARITSTALSLFSGQNLVVFSDAGTTAKFTLTGSTGAVVSTGSYRIDNIDGMFSIYKASDSYPKFYADDTSIGFGPGTDVIDVTITRTDASTLSINSDFVFNELAGIGWDNGSGSVDVSIFRGGVDTLTTYDTFEAANVNITGVYKVDGTQVVSNRIVDARIDDAVNESSWDSTTAGVLDAIRDALITHGLIAAS